MGSWELADYGFHCDLATPSPLSDKDLGRLTKEAQRLARLQLPIGVEKISLADANRLLEERDEKFLLDALHQGRDAGEASGALLIRLGERGAKDSWWTVLPASEVDLPQSTVALSTASLSLEAVSGCYWRGDESRPQLSRVGGSVWATAAQLAAYTHLRAEALARDHRRLGAQLDLFSVDDRAGVGLVLWHPRGAIIRHLMEAFWKDMHLNNGYELLYTPHIAKRQLWDQSGHTSFYSESMFRPMQVEEEEYQLRPMNCPFHVSVYSSRPRSHRELPLRWAELGTVYRFERSGTTHGLFRARGFTQDDAHVFCLPEQVEGEILGVLDLVESVFEAFGFRQFEVCLSTRPQGSVGSDAVWEHAEGALKDALGRKGWAYAEDSGGGAFYGPKIDVRIRDALGRSWQCSTVQLDFNLPERFGLEYAGSDGRQHRPIMIHRALFGSLERFFGVLVEHYAGRFPLWLAPTHLALVPVDAQAEAYAREVAAQMKASGVRVQVMGGASTSKLILNATKERVPLMAVVGPREAAAGTLSMRGGQGAQLGELPSGEVLDRIVEAIKTRGEF
ncbi:class II core domain (G, H, P, S and T) tRNA synthetase [Helicosporidium sp. ATCC 50920]|nr:class II core domain (G, H, P, S and T) tRNA synthetase [Helicosporidium sp. ATCC 50920]|eukprot:KDD75770.1 class II core domain (G, H, P, S and T) tRNA synthetase [Helicosporidium sp. ATCC 50920]